MTEDIFAKWSFIIIFSAVFTWEYKGNGFRKDDMKRGVVLGEWFIYIIMGKLKKEKKKKGGGLNPINIPDPVQKCFGYGQLWSLSPAYSQKGAGSYMSDPTSCI